MPRKLAEADGRREAPDTACDEPFRPRPATERRGAASCGTLEQEHPMTMDIVVAVQRDRPEPARLDPATAISSGRLAADSVDATEGPAYRCRRKGRIPNMPGGKCRNRTGGAFGAPRAGGFSEIDGRSPMRARASTQPSISTAFARLHHCSASSAIAALGAGLWFAVPAQAQETRSSIRARSPSPAFPEHSFPASRRACRRASTRSTRPSSTADARRLRVFDVSALGGPAVRPARLHAAALRGAGQPDRPGLRADL